MPFLTLGADMARPSRTGGKTSEAKARNAGPAKGRKTTKTKPRIAPAATRVKRRSVSDPSKDLKEAREQQAATAEILKVIASSPDDVQPVFEAIVANADRLIGGFSTGVYRFVDGIGHLGGLYAGQPGCGRGVESPVPAPDCRRVTIFERAHAGEVVAGRRHRSRAGCAVEGYSAGARLSKRVVRAPDEQGNGDWRHRRHPQEPRPVFSASRRAAADLRRPGRHRHRECAAVQRDAGGAGAADRDGGHPGGDQQFAGRSDSRCSTLFSRRPTAAAEPASARLHIHQGDDMHQIVAMRGMPPEFPDMPPRIRSGWARRRALGRLVRGESFVHIIDAADDEAYRLGNPVRRALVDIAGARTYLAVPIARTAAARVIYDLSSRSPPLRRRT